MSKKETTDVVGGLTLTVEVPLADRDRPGSTYEDLVAALKRAVNEVLLIHSIGQVNFKDSELKKFEEAK